MLHYAKTKIVCTLGPASSSVETIEKMIRAGMTVARVNFSHGSHDDHLATIKRVREAAANVGQPVAILQDLQGPKIRTGVLAAPVMLKEGARFTITIDDIVGTQERVSTTYKHLPLDVKPGDTILMDDGLLQLKAIEVTETDVITEVVNGGLLKDKKGINLPGVSVSSPSMTAKDETDLLFGIANEIDYVALSFVRTADDIRHLRAFITNAIGTKRLPVIAKIEKPEALADIDAIIAEADALMVARGDLGVETPTENVPMAQKMICRKANAAGKPVIIATQMLESMIENPRPTRAEANDVANAVLDGADAVMLSGETSVGKHVVTVVKTMCSIIRKAEEGAKDKLYLDDAASDEQAGVFRALGRSATLIAKNINAAAIVCVTHSGDMVKVIARYRPETPLIAVTDLERVQRRLKLVWGVESILISGIGDTDATFARIHEELIGSGVVQRGDYVVMTAGIPLLARNSTNMIKVEKLE
ncbi:MAG TPA: pyruvate kinase [Bacteroidota bacterium]|nr:pyruvate kinase [Bacteroidota bacterium]